MPYRIDLPATPHDALEKLIQLGALDIETVADGVAAIIPDDVTPDAVAGALGVPAVSVSAAVGLDDGSVWLLSPRAVRIGSVVIAPAEFSASPGALRLTGSSAFGSGHHTTTALCIEAIEECLTVLSPRSVLDVGTGSGVLALAALIMGVSQAAGVDIDPEALQIAAAHARLNNLSDRLRLVLGGPDVVEGAWPLVVANVLAAPLIEMAPVLVQRVEPRGRLILSGISSSLESDVRKTYQHLGMRHIRSETRGGWTVLVVEPTW